MMRGKFTSKHLCKRIIIMQYHPDTLMHIFLQTNSNHMRFNRHQFVTNLHQFACAVRQRKTTHVQSE